MDSTNAIDRRLVAMAKQIEGIAKAQGQAAKPKPKERQAPPVINVTVDAKTGKVTKSFSMKKTAAGAYEGTVTETEKE